MAATTDSPFKFPWYVHRYVRHIFFPKSFGTNHYLFLGLFLGEMDDSNEKEGGEHKIYENLFSSLSSGVTGGGGRGQSTPPGTSDREISADLPGKERQGKKGKWSRKEGKLKKGKVENWKWKEEKGKVNQMRRGPFFFFYFSNHWNLFWVNQNGNFLLGKSISGREKIRKNDFAPSEKYSCYVSVPQLMLSSLAKILTTPFESLRLLLMYYTWMYS